VVRWTSEGSGDGDGVMEKLGLNMAVRGIGRQGKRTRRVPVAEDLEVPRKVFPEIVGSRNSFADAWRPLNVMTLASGQQ
jgi:hypothetical protein